MKAVLVGISVWVDHFRQRTAALISLLDRDLALTHPMVWAEKGLPHARGAVGAHACGLESAAGTQKAGLPEVVDFIEREELCGQDRGLVDMVLWASTLITPGAQLWTPDKRLAALSERFGVMQPASLH